MEAFDTNVIVRLLARDDEDQGQRAERALREAAASGGVWVSQVVLAEVSWVLQAAYRFDRAATAEALSRLCQTEGVVLENEGVADAALTSFEAGAADFADYLILEGARVAHATPLRTFDERLARSTDVALV